ncbi:MAG: YcxB family protein [Lachnospiraceae bacterium]|nr:YcxB family protein [Lachnospiraceae bacterium]
MIQFDVKIKPKYLFDFSFWHQYSGFYGIINVFITVAAIALLISGAGKGSVQTLVALIVLACLFSVIQPVWIFIKALMRYKITPLFHNPITYTFSREKIVSAQGDQTAEVTWDALIFIRETPMVIALYFNRTSAVLIPKKEIGDKVLDLKKLICELADPHVARRLKGVSKFIDTDLPVQDTKKTAFNGKEETYTEEAEVSAQEETAEAANDNEEAGE